MWDSGRIFGHGESSLAETFPKLYRLSSYHGMSIANCTNPDLFPYSWDFGFRRNLREKDMEEMPNLLRMPEEVRLFPYREDVRRWCLETSGQFSCTKLGIKVHSQSFRSHYCRKFQLNSRADFQINLVLCIL